MQRRRHTHTDCKEEEARTHIARETRTGTARTKAHTHRMLERRNTKHIARKNKQETGLQARRYTNTDCEEDET